MNYNYRHLEDDIGILLKALNDAKPKHIVLDTETDGLDIILSKPFLIGVGFDKQLFTFPVRHLKTFAFFFNSSLKVFAHNAKFDYHMLLNAGLSSDNRLHILDSMTVARLTEYADMKTRLSLENLGVMYVDKTSKFASDVIQEHINSINRARLSDLKKKLKEEFGDLPMGQIMEAYHSRIKLVKTEYDHIFDYIDSVYKKPNYEDSYKENPDLMRSYLADDLVITLEYLEHALPVLDVTDPGHKIFSQENKLIKVVADMERVGLRADLNYLKESREKVLKYMDKKYASLRELTGRNFSSGQHQEIKKYFFEKHGIAMLKTDVNALEELSLTNEGIAKQVADLLIELRSLEKIKGTYIEGMMERVIGDRIYIGINNAGTVTGRVSGDMQQQPKEATYDDEGNELYHPRRVFINDEGTRTFYFDYSQMELRLQAHYTILLSGGDDNLCSAFMPWKHISSKTGETFKYGVHQWDSGEWVNAEGKPWKPTDLHAVSTLKAFPYLTLDHPDFKKMRSIGKQANFLKNYGGGTGAIRRQLKLSEDAVQAINRGYYEAFPKIADYQRWVEEQLTLYGFVSNLFGRRYYMSETQWYYKAYNYIIQGGCADLLKLKEILVDDFIKKNKLKSRILLPIHDELQLSIPKDEEWIVPKIKAILDDNDTLIGTLPMLCDVEVTNSNWAEKEDFE